MQLKIIMGMMKIDVNYALSVKEHLVSCLCMVGCKFLPPTTETSVKLYDFAKLTCRRVFFSN